MAESRLMLDTSAIAGFFKGDPTVAGYVKTSDELYVNPVVSGELLAGFKAGRSERENIELLSRFLTSPRMRSLDIDMETSERYAVIQSGLRKKGTPIPTNDIWIAATAMQYGLRLLTADRHFLKVPQIIVDFFEVF